MAAKNRLTERLDVGDPSIQGNYHGKTAKNHDEDAHYDQPPDGKSERRVGELVEWHPCSDKDERSDVEEEINNRGEHRFLGLFVEESIPSKRRAAANARRVMLW